MLPLQLSLPADGPLKVLAIGAHPDDIEIGAGGTLLGLVATRTQVEVRYVVLTGTELRRAEATHAAESFLAGADVSIELHDLPEGRFPGAWGDVKDAIEGVAASFAPDIVLGPSDDDAHQDHRTIGQILPTVFRNSLCLAYEIPKWDGDLRRPSVYVPLTASGIQRKVELLHKCFPSQRGRDWWDDEVFAGLARLRGMECRAPYAEAFNCSKMTLLTGNGAAG